MAQAARRKQEEEVYKDIWRDKKKPSFTRPKLGSEEHEGLLRRQGYSPTQAYKIKSFHRDRAARMTRSR